MKKSLLLLITLTLVYGCGTLNIEKRRYNKGFYVNWSRNSQKESKKETAEKSPVMSQALVDQTIVDTAHHYTMALPEQRSVCGTEDKIERSTENSSRITFETAHTKRSKTAGTSFNSAPIKANAMNASRPVNRTEQVVLTNGTSSKSKNWFYAIFAALPFMFLFRKKASRISAWAANNKRQSRGLIVILSSMSALSSFSLGTLTGWNMDSTAMLTSMGLIGTAAFLNTIRLGNGLNFMKNKFSFVMMGMTGAFSFFGLGSRYRDEVFQTLGTSEGELAIHPVVVFLLTLVLIAATIALLYGIAVVACNIACYGNELVAAIVFFGGIFLTVVLFTFALQYIYRKVGQSSDEFAKNALIAGLLALVIMALVIFGSAML